MMLKFVNFITLSPPCNDFLPRFRRKAYSKLFLSDQDVGGGLGEILHLLAEHAGRVTYQPPLFEVTSLVIELRQ